MSQIRQEYLPYVGRVVWIKYETVELEQKVESSVSRLMVWGVYSWSDAVGGPFEEFRWQPFGLKAVA